MNTINLLDNIRIKDYNFVNNQEELFSSSSWSEEILIDSERITKKNSIINGTAIKKNLGDYVIYQMFDGICDSEDIDSADLKTNCIEIPVMHKEESYSQGVQEKTPMLYPSYDDFQIEIHEHDYRILFNKIKRDLHKSSNIDLIEIVGYCQYVLFRYLNSDGKSGYGYKNVLSISIKYNSQGYISAKNITNIGTDFASAINEVSFSIIKEAQANYSTVREKRTIESDTEIIIIPSWLFAKMINVFYFTHYMFFYKGGSHSIPEISKLISINLNDPENKSVGGTIDGAGKRLELIPLCVHGISDSCIDVLRKYDYRANAKFTLDKVRVVSGKDNILDYRSGNVFEIFDIQGLEESYDYTSFEFNAFIKMHEYCRGTIKNHIILTQKLNIVQILKNVVAIGNICRYELDGQMLLPDVVVKRECIEREKICI